MADDNPFDDASVSNAPEPNWAMANPMGERDAEPSWARDAPPAIEPPPPPPLAEEPAWARRAPAAPPANTAPLAPAGQPPMDVSCLQLPKPIMGLRAANLISAGFLALTAILKLMTMPSLTSAVVCLYLLTFAVLLTVFELHMGITAKLIADNLGFMYFGRVDIFVRLS